MDPKRKNPSTLRPTGKDLYLNMSIPRLFQILSIQKNKANRRFLILLYENSTTRKETTRFVGMSRRRRFTTIRTTPFATVANIR